MSMRDSTRPVVRSDFELLMNHIKELQIRVDRLENERRPTVPIYDSSNFPGKSAEGQIAIAPVV